MPVSHIAPRTVEVSHDSPVASIEDALSYAARGWPIVPTWTVMPDGSCECASAECVHPGKHPRSDEEHHALVGSTDPNVIRGWYSRWPQAGVGVDLERAQLVDIAPDSETWLATFGGPGYGLPRTPSFASPGGAGHEHHLYQRPESCPARRICMTGQYDIMAAGIAVLPPSRGRYWLVPPDQATLATVPLWAFDRLRAAEEKQQQARAIVRQAAVDAEGEPPVRMYGEALARWRGEVVKMGGQGPGGVNRSDSLFIIALRLADANAGYRVILEAVRDRDTALGWAKYSARSDAEEQYAAIASKALAEVLAPRLHFEGVGNWPEHQAEPGPANGSCSPHCDRHLEVERQYHELQKQNALRAALFRRPKKELTPADKLVGLAILNMQASRESRGQTGRMRVVMDAAEPDPEREDWPDNSLVATVGMSDSTIRRSLDRLAPIQGGGLWEREYEPFTTTKGIPSKRLYLVPTEDRPAPEQWKTIVSYVPPEEPPKPKAAAAVVVEDIRCGRHPMALINDDTTRTWRCHKCGRDAKKPVHLRMVIDPDNYVPPVVSDPLVVGDVEPGPAPGRDLWADFPALQIEGLAEEPTTVSPVLNGIQIEGLDREEQPPAPRGAHACHACGAFADANYGPVVEVSGHWLHFWPNAPCRMPVEAVAS